MIELTCNYGTGLFRIDSVASINKRVQLRVTLLGILSHGGLGGNCIAEVSINTEKERLGNQRGYLPPSRGGNKLRSC
jgi:hypothetical protein